MDAGVIGAGSRPPPPRYWWTAAAADRPSAIAHTISDGPRRASPATKTHVSRVLAKLGLRSRVQAAIAARGLSMD